MRVDIKNEQNMIYINLVGRLDTNSSPEFQSKVEAYISKESFHIILDFAELEFLSSAGLRVLLLIQKKATAVNGTLVLRNVNEEIKEVFEMTGFSDFLTIEK